MSYCERRQGLQAGAYSPRTNIMYYGLQNTCNNLTAVDDQSAYEIRGRGSILPGADKIGTLFAISVETGKVGLAV